MGDVDAERPQLDVKACDLLESELDEPDVGDLRAEVEVDELEDVESAEGAQLVDDMALLVDLDRIDSRVPPRVLELLNGGLEAAGERLDPRAKDVRETEEN